ncbi:MAG: lipopolysaccharide biosynthesis protein [Bacteroidota bacterium]
MGLGDKIFQGMAWSAIERISIQIVQFAIGIILARILTPEEYGIIGILMVFIVVSEVFIESGFTQALIQKQDRTEADISTVFLFNVAISILCYGILWLVAPYISDFYKLEELTSLLRILALTLLLNALFAVPSTMFTIKLDFKSLAKFNLTAVLISGGIAIYLAVSGYGVWALVWQTIIRSGVKALLIWVFVKWRPKTIFSKSSFKKMFAFGSNVLLSSLLTSIVNNIYALLIAKFTTTQDLGYYTRGTQFTSFIQKIIKSMLGRVLLPGLSQVQDQREVLISYYRKIIRATSVIVVPVFLLLAIVAKPLILLLLTEKWLDAVPIMQIFCFARMITLISGVNVNLLYVIGRTDLSLRQLLVKLAVRIVFFIIALKYGIIYIALAELVSTIIHFYINTYYPGKIMSYGSFSQIKDIAPIGLSGVIMGGLAFGAIYFIESSLLKIIVATLVAVPTYIVFMRLFKIEESFAIVRKTTGFFNKKS